MGLNLFPKSFSDRRALYVDGGVIKKNPSELGGTYAVVHVEDDKEVCNISGIVIPSDVGLPKVTNNMTELIAAVVGMELLPESYDGILWTDSMVTYLRLSHRNASMIGIPEIWQKRFKHLVKRLPKLGFGHLGGHPTPEDLERGYKIGKKGNQLKVSKWNVLCDTLCNARAKEFLEKC